MAMSGGEGREGGVLSGLGTHIISRSQCTELEGSVCFPPSLFRKVLQRVDSSSVSHASKDIRRGGRIRLHPAAAELCPGMCAATGRKQGRGERGARCAGEEEV